jgi:uncharacterized protein (TIGR03382 family)
MRQKTMKKLLLAVLACAVIASTAKQANADVILTPMLSGTGDNVVFDSLLGNLAIGSFNGQNQGLVNFTDLSNNPLFTASANGNDIKIANTNDLQIQVFQNNDITALGTTTQVFSLKGTGDVTAFIFAVTAGGVMEAAQVFDLGVINPSAQSGFTFQSINGEVMDRMVLLDTSGMISDYEHYRIDAVPLPSVSVPGPVVGTGVPGLLAFAGLGMVALRRRRKQAS